MKVINRDAEVKLIELLNDIQDSATGWTAVCLAFSRLLDHYKSEYQIKIAINMINDAVGNAEGAIYLCDDSTIYVVARSVPRSLVDKLVFQLRYLFMDDPLAYTADGEENPEFSMTYELERAWKDFMQICKGRLTQKVRRVNQAAGRAAPTAPAIPKAAAAKVEAGGGAVESSGTPMAAMGDKEEKLEQFAAPAERAAKDNKILAASDLVSIERDLTNADLSKVMRRQPICAAVPDTLVRRVFDEIYINIAHLRKMLHTDVDLLSNRWLFKYLTQILDERMLFLIQRAPGRYLDAPISLNLNVPTLLSNRFMEFDASIKPAVKVSIVIEIQVADVFADMSAFLVAKDTVQKLGYRVCLDGVTDLSFTQIDRQRLGFDLVKLQWNADIESEIKSEKNIAVMNAMRNCGANRVILTRCDTRKAVEYGQAMGISLFQGRYLDTLLNPRATIEN